MNFSRALLLEREQAALDRADARGGNVAVVGLQLLRVIADVLQHRAEILEIEQQQAVVVGHLEDERQHARLRFVQVEHARQQQRARDPRRSRGSGGPARRRRPRTRPGIRRRPAPSTPISLRRSSSFGDAAPGCVMPERSPLTSAMNTGTPIREKRSAITCSVTVFPVPVAPVMRPWRLASAGSRQSSVSLILRNGQRIGHGGSRVRGRSSV